MLATIEIIIVKTGEYNKTFVLFSSFIFSFVKVKFLGIDYTLKFDQQSFEYSADLLKDYGLSQKVSAFKKNNPKIAQFFGIK